MPSPVASSPVLIAESDRIPLGQKIAFGAGNCMDWFATGLTIGVFWMPYFNIGLGISPARLGFVLMVLMAWNAILDPVMGNISDNARTRWGRRRPFMAVGAVLTSLMSPWIWRPPTAWGENGMVIYLVVVGMIFYACFSCWAMPYYGLQLELTPNYDERTRLTAWITFFGKIAGLIGGWAMAIVTGPWFADAVTGKPDIVHGMKTCSWFIAGIILALGLLPPIFVRERYYEAEAKHQARDPFWQSIRESFHCRPLWLLIGISFFLVVGSASVGNTRCFKVVRDFFLSLARLPLDFSYFLARLLLDFSYFLPLLHYLTLHILKFAKNAIFNLHLLSHLRFQYRRL